jgi:hypothetical protein
MLSRVWFFSALLILTGACCIHSNAQKPDWIRGADPVSGVYGESLSKRMVVHPDGNVFVIGQYFGSLYFSAELVTAPSNTLSDIFLAKYAPNGNLIWVKQLTVSDLYYANRPMDIKVDRDGNLIFSGSCLTPSSILGSNKGTGPFIAKIDKDGNRKWVYFPPLSGGAIREYDNGRRGNRIGFDKDHNICWLIDQTNESKLTGGLEVWRFAPDGTKLSNKVLTHSPSYYRPNLEGFSVDHEGNFTVSGTFESSIAFIGGPSLIANGSNVNRNQFFLARFTADGQFLWVVYSSGARNHISTHTVDNVGNIYVALTFFAGGLIHTPSESIPGASENQLVLARISPDGKVEWMNPFPASVVGSIPLLGNIEDISFAADGLLYVTGSVSGYEFRYQSYVRSVVRYSTYVLKIDTKGNFRGVYVGEPEDLSTSPNGAQVYSYQSTVDSDGNIYTHGNFIEKQVWSCVPAVAPQPSFFLLKHIAAQSPVRTISGPGTICAGTQITLSTQLVSNGVLYKWFMPGNDVPVPGELLKNSITMVGSQAFDRKPVIVSLTDACDEYFAEPYVLDIPAPPESPTVLGEEMVCPGTASDYQVEDFHADFRYVWTLPGEVSASTLAGAGGTFIFSPDFRVGDVKVSVANACGAANTTFRIVGDVTPPETPQHILGSENVCAGSTEHYSIQDVDGGLDYQWTLPHGISAPSLSETGGTFFFSSDFHSGDVTISVSDGCLSSDTTFVIKVHDKPSAPELGGSKEICPGFIPLQLSITQGTSTLSYFWELPPLISFNPLYSTGGATLNALADNSFVSGKIKVRTVGHCEMSDVSTVLIIRAPKPGAAQPPTGIEEICTEPQKKIRYTTSPIPHATTYIWKIPDLFGARTEMTTEPYIDLEAQVTGTSELIINGNDRCGTDGASASILISAFAPLTPEISISSCDATITASGADTFSWYLNGKLLPQISGSELILSDSGVYHVEAENFCGLKQSNKIRAYPIAPSDVLIPNIITPNGDGANDVLILEKPLSNSRVSIVSRWGEEIYFSPDYQNLWTAEGLSAGTYYLTVHHPCIPGGYKGWLTVMK